MDPALLAMCHETVQHERYLSQDAYGTPTYAAAVALTAYIEAKPQRFVTAAGEERLSRALVIVDGTAQIDLRDKLTLPDGTAPALLRVATMRDENGAIDHLEVLV